MHVLHNRFWIAALVLAGLMLPAFAQEKKPDATKPDNKKPPAKPEATKPAPQPAAGGAVDLHWKFKKGETFYQTMTTKTEQNLTVMGMKITQNQSQTFYFKWTAVDQKDKNWIVKQEIIGVKMDIQIGGNPITYDSTQSKNTTNPLSDFFKALVGSTFTLTVAPDGNVTEVKGRDDFIKRLGQVNGSMEPLLKQILTEDSLKDMVNPAFAVAPNKEVKPGESWEKKSTLNMGPIGSYDTTYKYTLEGKDKKNAKLDDLKVDTTLKYVPPAANAASTGAQLPFQIKKADLKATNATGQIQFDNDNGRVASSKMDLTLDGTLDIEIQGMTAQVTLNQKQTTTVDTSDKNPITPAVAEKPAANPADKKP
jgi:hypothetical protein